MSFLNTMRESKTEVEPRKPLSDEEIVDLAAAIEEMVKKHMQDSFNRRNWSVFIASKIGGLKTDLSFNIDQQQRVFHYAADSREYEFTYKDLYNTICKIFEKDIDIVVDSDFWNGIYIQWKGGPMFLAQKYFKKWWLVSQASKSKIDFSDVDPLYDFGQ